MSDFYLNGEEETGEGEEAEEEKEAEGTPEAEEEI